MAVGTDASLLVLDHHAFHEDAKPRNLSFQFGTRRWRSSSNQLVTTMNLSGAESACCAATFICPTITRFPSGWRSDAGEMVSSREEGVPRQDHRGRLSLEAGGLERDERNALVAVRFGTRTSAVTWRSA